MPAEKKTGKKDAKCKVAKPAPVPANVTVRDCLVWPNSADKDKSNQNGGTNCSKSAEQNHCQQQQHVEVDLPPPPPKEKKDEGTVIEALRGWPSHHRAEQCEEMDVDYEPEVEEVSKPPAKPPKKSTAKQNCGKPAAKNPKRVSVKEPDVSMADIMSQRFLNEFADERRAEMDRELQGREQKAQAAKEGRRAAKDRTDIKANKAAQLRSIALAVKVETTPMDLWKMPKFTRDAKPHLSTFRNGSSAGGNDGGYVGGGGGGRGGGGGGGGSGQDDYGPCTCYDQNLYYGEEDGTEEIMNQSCGHGSYEFQSPENPCA